MKIVATVPWARALGGAETMLTAFLGSVDRRSLDVVVVFFEDGPLVDEVDALGHRAVVLPAGRLRQIRRTVRVVFSLARLLEAEQPDLLLNWTPKAQLLGSSAAALAHQTGRVVWWQHGVAGHHWLDRLATLLPTRAVVCSSHYAAAAQRAVRPARPVFAVHPGVDFPPASTSRSRTGQRARLGIPSGRRVVGLVGRLEPGKRHERFLEVVAELGRRGHAVHALVIGGGLPGSPPDPVQRLEAEVKRRSLDEVVSVTGQVADARPYIELMDVLVSLSSMESFGIAIVEAMALGVPVVATAEGGPSEIIESGRTGLLLESVSVDEVADAVQHVLSDAHLRNRLRAGARARFLSDFTAARMTAEIELLLRHLCRR
jgi:glycosyltransferase involved in cell wall biosynthesis